MKTTEYEAHGERLVLTAMVTSTAALARLAPRWVPSGHFHSPWANIVGGWCVEYFNKYGRAPQADIEGKFRSWADKGPDPAMVGLVDDYLGGLSGAYEAEGDEVNPDYAVDTAAALWRDVALERLAEDIRSNLANKDGEAAQHAANSYQAPNLSGLAYIDVLQDTEAMAAAFEQAGAGLVQYPGALGQFFGPQLGRDEFVAFIGATGRGKSWWLMDLAWRAMRQGRRVAYFEVGDMSEAQLLRRMGTRAARHPSKAPYDVRYPTSITPPTSGGGTGGPSVADVVFEDLSFEGPLTGPQAAKALARYTRRHKGPRLRMQPHPADTATVAGIGATLQDWEMQGWMADVVVVDYADLLAAPYGYQPGDREAINANWKALRGLSQQRHCLVVTATQGDANSYNAHTMGRGNFSDDRRKNDHVTGMVGINQTPEEKEYGIMRLNWTKRRDAEYQESRCVHVAGCLALGQPAVVSTW